MSDQPDTALEAAVYKSCGGNLIATGDGSAAWDFGWRPSDPAFTSQLMTSNPTEDIAEIKGDKVFLWEYAKQCNGGKHPPYNYQLTGSCVNGGGQNAAIIRIGVECVNLGHPEVFKLPFTLSAYGYSRHLFGDEREGEGLMGDTMAKALEEVGVTTLDDPLVPQPRIFQNAFCYTEQTELKYSAWKNTPQALRDAAKPHPFNYIVIKNLDEAERELRRGRPLTWAGDWGGKMKCSYKGEGKNRILWNGGRSSTWNHQQSCPGVWIHPEFGRIWYILNQWYMIQGGIAVPVHGDPANGEMPGGYWVGDADMNYQCKSGEVRAIWNFTGFVKGLIAFGNI